VLLPKGQSHVLRDHAGSAVLPADEVFSGCPSKGGCQPGGLLKHGGGGALTVLISGCFTFEDAGSRNPLIAALPAVLHVRGDLGAPTHWLEASLQFVASEMASGQPGAQTVVSRLVDILLVQAVRAHLEQIGDAANGWLRALVDPQVGAALSAIHQQPEAPWTVESLAERAGMSRSGFAARFTQLVEEPPLTYLTDWRMQKASRLLRASASGLGDIAGRVGYETEAAFSKAFKRWAGMAPGAFRRVGPAGPQRAGAGLSAG
jgi:AraC-like DNA-binding protein